MSVEKKKEGSVEPTGGEEHLYSFWQACGWNLCLLPHVLC
jgi:hypothetical protein